MPGRWLYDDVDEPDGLLHPWRYRPQSAYLLSISFRKLCDARRQYFARAVGLRSASPSRFRQLLRLPPVRTDSQAIHSSQSQALGKLDQTLAATVLTGTLQMQPPPNAIHHCAY